MVKKTIIINNTPFVYEESIISYDNIRPITEDEAKELLSQTKRLFSQKGLNFYLAFGTLLGAVRDKTIVPGDEDVDVFVDNEKLLISILPFLYDNGLTLFRRIEGRIYSFWGSNGCYIDVYILRPLKHSLWSLYCYNLSRLVIPKRFFKEYQDIFFLGDIYKCPKEPEKFLEFIYGKTWRTPIPNNHTNNEVKSHYYWQKYYKKTKRFIQSIIFWEKWKHILGK